MNSQELEMIHGRSSTMRGWGELDQVELGELNQKELR